MSSFIQNVFPRPSRADEEFPFTETLAAPTRGATAVHIRPCLIRRCRQHIGTLSGGKPRNRAKPSNSGTFQCKIRHLRPLGRTLLHCRNMESGSRSAARKTIHWCAARESTPTTSTCRAKPMRGSCGPAMPMGSYAASTRQQPRRCPVCSASGREPISPAPITARSPAGCHSRAATARPSFRLTEPRAGLASYDKSSDRYTIHVPTQGVAGNRTNLAKNILKVPDEKVHLLTPNVGGSFGMKNINYPEYVCILHAAKALGRPVKWTDERSTSFLSDSHGRAQKIHCELALDSEGKFLALKVSGYGNLGSYITGVAPLPLSLNIGKNIASVYRTPLMSVDIKTVLTNTTLMGAYRGAGRPEANYFMERLIDRAAEEMGINRLTLRKRNFIKPAQMPFAASSGVTYDSGDFQGVFNKALEISDHANFAKRKKESRKVGKLRGIAVGSYLEVTAPPGVELGKIVFENDGSVRLITGTLDYGQGHASPFAQVLSAQLGVPFESIKLEQGDSDVVHTGNGTGGSRSITASGMAIVEASNRVIEKGKRAAAHLMEAAEADIEFSQGRFTIAGTDRSIDIVELAQRLRQGKMPDGVPSSLDVDHTTEAVPSTFPNGCHVAEVEIDPDTGIVQIVRYTGVNDFGTIVNPLLVAGQMHGGVAQGIGQALMECVSYDASGQPITGSFMDYAMPRAEDIPMMAVGDHPVPAKSNRLGTKGCGEAGCAGSLSVIVNAVVDALSEYGITHIDMPLTPERVWRAIEDAKKKAA